MTSPIEHEWQAQLSAVTAELVNSQDRYLTLLDMAKALRRAMDIEEALRLTASAAARILNAEVVISAESSSHRMLLAQYPVSEKVGLGEMAVATQPSPVEIAGGAMDDGRPLTWMRIRQSDAPVGILFAIGAHGRVFGSPERKLLRAITEQLGAALESIAQNEMRLAQALTQAELRLAQTVQFHLLPPEPGDVPGLCVSGVSLPARSVGGDFYTYAGGSTDQWQVCVGDVAGKGMPSALLMTMLSTTIRNAGRFSDISGPAALLGFVNDALYEEMDRVGMFTTIFAACHDPERRELRYANAGHSPVIFAPAEGPARLLEADDMPVGVMAGMIPVERVIPFAEGDVLIIGTDGLTDARNAAGALFGLERLIAIVEAEKDGHAAAIRDAVLTAIDHFRMNEPQADDLTLVILQGNHT